ncbi:hypothetical protein [Saliterribacillus persicus]|uniref:Uncharacterized protein n=1 Tax=Saliterribacillus persicus TaxID=930114 RepID=A0A368XRP0_9BACI|nr:hypothetical protein [Saliterribacillus persicus]RCW70631.1 hypothetical protein DFR57_10628 [Saliterribacillus persicus]
MRFIGVDPASKTEFVALDESVQVLKAKELTGIGDKDPKRMITLIFDIMQHIKKMTLSVLKVLHLIHKRQCLPVACITVLRMNSSEED